MATWTYAEQVRFADEAIDKAWHYLHGDGADPAIGQGFATLAAAHATMALAAQREDQADA
jgi:hypothetical protein